MLLSCPLRHKKAEGSGLFFVFHAKEAAEPPKPSEEVLLLQEIRDELKKSNGKK